MKLYLQQELERGGGVFKYERLSSTGIKVRLRIRKDAFNRNQREV